MKFSREQKSDFIIIAALVAFVLAYFLPGMIGSAYLPLSNVWWAESQHQWIPFWKFTAAMMRDGLMPLWSPHFFCGFPYLSYPPINLYYPPFWVLAQFSHLHAVYLDTIIGFICMGYFTYFCLRAMRLSPSASLAGMLTVVTGGYFVTYSTYAMGCREWFYAITSWAVAGIIYKRRSFKYLFFLVLGYAFGSGLDAEQLIYVAFFHTGWVLAASNSGERLKNLLVGGLAMGMAFSLLGLAPLINLAGFFPHNVRSLGVSFDGYLQSSQNWQTLIAWLLPYDTPTSGQIFFFYLGWSTVILSAFGIKRLGKKAWPSLAALAGYGLFSIGGENTLRFFYHVPILNRTILHYGALVVVFMIIAGWSGLGMQELKKKFAAQKVLWVFLATSALLMAFEITGSKSHAFSYHWFRPLFLILLMAAGLALALSKRPLSSNALTIFVTAFLIIDFSLVNLSTRPKAKKEFFEPSPVLQKIMRENDFSRFWPVTDENLADSQLVPLMGMQLDPLLTGTHTPLGYWRVPERRTADVINLLAPGFVKYDAAGKFEKFDLTIPLGMKTIGPVQARLLSLLNVGVLVSRGIKVNTDWPDATRGEYTVYKNTGVLPRAFMVGKIVMADTDEKGLGLLLSPEIDLSQTVIMEKGFHEKIDPDGNALLCVSKFRPGYWEFETEVDSAKLLLLSESYYPGWRTFIDGAEERVYHADYAFMAAKAPAGRHHMIMQFEPAAFHVGMWASLASYLNLLFTGAIFFSVRALIRRGNQ
jgi:hypothetical protein